MRIIVSLFALAMSSCIAMTPRSVQPGPTASTITPMTLDRWGIESCGAGSLSAVLQHYGDPTSMKTWDTTLPKTRGGVLTIDMLIAARSHGFDARLVTGDRALVEKELDGGRPVILMLQVVDSPGHAYDFFHYVVADGIDHDRGLVRVQFGDRRGRWTTFDRLEKLWTGGGHAAILIRPATEEDRLRAAVALESEGKYADAENAYRTLLSTRRDWPLVWTNLGNVQKQLAKIDDAERSYRSALSTDPAFRDALNNLAWLLFEQRRLPEAEKFARQAVNESGPDQYLVLDTLAQILAARGACNDADSTYQRALDSLPSSKTDERSALARSRDEAAKTCRQ